MRDLQTRTRRRPGSQSGRRAPMPPPARPLPRRRGTVRRHVRRLLLRYPAVIFMLGFLTTVAFYILLTRLWGVHLPICPHH